MNHVDSLSQYVHYFCQRGVHTLGVSTVQTGIGKLKQNIAELTEKNGNSIM